MVDCDFYEPYVDSCFEQSRWDQLNRSMINNTKTQIKYLLKEKNQGQDILTVTFLQDLSSCTLINGNTKVPQSIQQQKGRT